MFSQITSNGQMMPKLNCRNHFFFVTFTKCLNTIGQHQNPQWGWAKFYGIRSRFHAIFFFSFSLVVPFNRNAVFILITLVLLSQTSFLMLNSYYMFQFIRMSASCSRSADSKRWKIILPHDFEDGRRKRNLIWMSYIHCSEKIKLSIGRWSRIDENKSFCDGPIFLG